MKIKKINDKMLDVVGQAVCDKDDCLKDCCKTTYAGDKSLSAGCIKVETSNSSWSPKN